MNLLLLAQTDLEAPGVASVAAGRYPARHDAWPPPVGRRLRIGMRNGLAGEGIVEAVSATQVRLRFTLHAAPPAPLPLTLLLALPRPKMLRRILRSCGELGIKRIYLLNSSRVEKSYWQSPLLAGHALDQYLQAGLEQACDTVFPEVFLRQRLRPFVEDELPGVAAGSLRLLAHPEAARSCGRPARGPITLAIGPEGGFTDFEVALFGTAGFAAFTLGARVLRVETALPVAVANLFPAAADLSSGAADDAGNHPPATPLR